MDQIKIDQNAKQTEVRWLRLCFVSHPLSGIWSIIKTRQWKILLSSRTRPLGAMENTQEYKIRAWFKSFLCIVWLYLYFSLLNLTKLFCFCFIYLHLHYISLFVFRFLIRINNSQKISKTGPISHYLYFEYLKTVNGLCTFYRKD